MYTGKRFVQTLLIVSGFILLIFLIMQPFFVQHFQDYISVLFPKGIIALEERNLLLILQGIMLLVVIPVYFLTFWFSWKFRASNPKHDYDPDLVDSALAEVIWWGVPFVIVAIIGVLTWQKTYALDPYKPIESDKKPITIQVVALQWKWLFIYPEQQIASLNFLQIPKETPIRFEITSDAPMNSFWIPHLGGQIYAMPKMRTELNLISHETGDFRGSSANISGEGFAGMNFITRASTDEDFDEWVKTVKNSKGTLNWETYAGLAKPSQNNPPETFQLKDNDLFNRVLMKYMQPEEKKEDVRQTHH